MDQLSTIFTATFAVFGAVFIGLVARKREWLTQEADASLLRVIINVLLPCLIFRVVAGNEHLRQAEHVVLPPLVGFGSVALGCLTGYAFARVLGAKIGLDTAAKQRTFALCVGMYNFGYIPIPLVEMLFGQGTLGLLFVHNTGVEAALWTVGLLTLTGGLRAGWWKHLLNPPLVAIAVGLLFNFTGASAYVPGFASQIILWLGQAAIPVGLVLVGATIGDALEGATGGLGLSTISAALALRLALLPALFLTVAWALPTDLLPLKQIITVQAAMPAAVFPIILVKHYGGDSSTALRVALGTSALSLLTTPLWLAVGLPMVSP